MAQSNHGIYFQIDLDPRATAKPQFWPILDTLFKFGDEVRSLRQLVEARRLQAQITKPSMFYLSGRGIPGSVKSCTGDEFGWYLGAYERIEDRIYNDSSKIVRSPEVSCIKRVKTPAGDTSSLGSTNSSTDSGNSESYTLGKDFGKPKDADEESERSENIEMKSFKGARDHEVDEKDRVFTSSTRSTKCRTTLKVEKDSDDEEEESRICYTPERLVRCQEYRILTHSPKFFAIPRSTPNSIDDTRVRKHRNHRRRDFMDNKQIGASHLEIFLDPAAPEVRLPIGNRRRLNFQDRVSSKNIEEDEKIGLGDTLTITRESNSAFPSLDLPSTRSSYERLNNSWEESTRVMSRSSQDTSGIHSNDWSSDTPSDIPTPVCLCDELATASRSFSNFRETRNRTAAINEVVSILEDLERNPNRATTLLEEDRFCEASSGHDNLTRLALSIEPDGAVPPAPGDTESLLIELRDKVERLQEASRDIFKDIDCLRSDFEYSESKVDDLLDGTVTLRQNINEMNYLDDLLILLDGELERISRRNWPFVFGHSESRSEDMNLVV